MLKGEMMHVLLENIEEKSIKFGKRRGRTLLDQVKAQLLIGIHMQGTLLLFRSD